jgi:large subunit ribosomal protein L31e
MADLKREYVVPLRRRTSTAPKWRRSKKAVSVLKEFIRKHMKAENVIICNDLNEHVWSRGGKNPPGKVEVIALKTQVNGVESTIVNLLSKGIDKQLETYIKNTPQNASAKPVVDAKVEEKKEKESTEAKVEETKTGVKDTKEESKKEETKEVKEK